MKPSPRPHILAILIAIIVIICGAVLLWPRPTSKPAPALSETQIASPDAVIDIKIRDNQVISPSTTNFRVKHGSVTKLRFFVEGEEAEIVLTGNGVEINTEADETSELPGSIVVGGLDVGTYELTAIPEDEIKLEPSQRQKHVLGKVEVVR